MAHFNLENELSNALTFDAPLSKGPAPRWQRKELETSMGNLTINSSLNESTMLNKSVNKSGVKPSPRKTHGM